MQQNTQEWLDFRKRGIGASDVASILGLNPYRSAYQLFLEKMGKADAVESPMSRYGKEMEEIARDAFISKHGILVFPRVCVSKRTNTPWAFASLDGMSLDDSTILEIKCPFYAEKAVEMSKQIPPMYYAQMQYQMFVTELNECHFWVYRPDFQHHEIVKRDDNFISDMMQKAETFYVEHMLKKVAPPRFDNSLDMSNDTWWNDKAARLKQIKAEIANLERESDAIREEMVTFANGSNCHTQEMKMTKVESKGRIKYESIPILQGIDLEPFRSPPTIWWKFTF